MTAYDSIQLTPLILDRRPTMTHGGGGTPPRVPPDSAPEVFIRAFQTFPSLHYFVCVWADLTLLVLALYHLHSACCHFIRCISVQYSTLFISIVVHHQPARTQRTLEPTL